MKPSFFNFILCKLLNPAVVKKKNLMVMPHVSAWHLTHQLHWKDPKWKLMWDLKTCPSDDCVIEFLKDDNSYCIIFLSKK